jgi:IMP dehydrogenase
MRLEELGVNAIKVGIGPGAACTTRKVTGAGRGQLTAIMECANVAQVPIIADGGITTSGDIVKALGAGASTVMLGRLLAGCDESPNPGLYWGNASARVNGHRAPEGVEGTVERTGSLEDTIKPLLWGIRSGVSYAGFTSVKDMIGNVTFERISPGVVNESAARI